MPAAALIGALAVIAFAFAAIAADLLIRQLVINPINGAAAAAAEVAVVGGVLSWLLGKIVQLVELYLAGVNALVGAAESQAADTWNWLISATTGWMWHWAWEAAGQYAANASAILYAAANFPNLNSFVWNHVWALTQSVSHNFDNLNSFVWNRVWALAQQTAGDLAGLHAWIDNYELPLIRGIGNDLAGLRDWINSNVATRADVRSAEAAAIAAASALVVPITEAITNIEDSPCMQVCEPLGGLGNLLQGLEDAGMIVILLAIITETESDPVGVQKILQGTVVPILKDAVSSSGVS